MNGSKKSREAAARSEEKPVAQKKSAPVAARSAEKPAQKRNVPITARTESPRQERTETELKLSAPNAWSVAVAGTFNNWQADANPLQKGADGIWRARLILAPGRYEYRFVVDGQWVEDPQAKESAPNPFGGSNSVLSVLEAEKPAYAGAW